MRAILRIIAVVLFLTVIGLAAFVALPTLSPPSRVNYAALITKHSAMIRLVPSDAEDVILVPSAGSTLRLLRSNSVARDALRQLLPAAESAALPWALGGGDLVAWRTDHDSGFIVRTDAMRRILLPLFSNRISRSGEYLVSGRSSGGFELPDLENLLGHVFIIRARGDDGFPPLPAPVITGVEMNTAIHVRAVSARTDADRSALLSDAVRLPQSAILTAAFASVPELIRRMEQTLPVEVSPLMERGGMIAIYQLHDDRLLPRPRGVIVVPVTDATFPRYRRQLESLSPELPFNLSEQEQREVMGRTVVRRASIGFTLEYTRRDGELIIAFDKSSIEKFLTDTVRLVEVGPGGAEWLLLLDPQRLFPALEDMRQHAGLRVLLPDLARALDQFSESVEFVRTATEVVAVKRSSNPGEELEITILSSK
jgi:hypothetical protein